MSEELPDHLKPIRDILMDSANGPDGDDAPGAPEDLLDDLERSLTGTKVVPTPVLQPGFFEKLRSLIATPAFGTVAALVVVLFVAVPLFKGGHGFRNTGEENRDTAPIVLLGFDDEAYQRLVSNKLFDPRGLMRVSTQEQADAITSPKIVIDLENSILKAYDAGGNDFYRAPLKSEATLPTDIANALAKLPPSP